MEPSKAIMEIKMNKSYYIFKVSGYGEFPSATLRASMSWPIDRDNGSKVYSPTPSYIEERTIELTSPNRPIDSIWREYGWRVTSVCGGVPKEDYNLYHTWPA